VEGGASHIPFSRGSAIEVWFTTMKVGGKRESGLPTNLVKLHFPGKEGELTWGARSIRGAKLTGGVFREASIQSTPGAGRGIKRSSPQT